MVLPKFLSRHLLFSAGGIVLGLIVLSWLLGLLPQLEWAALIAFAIAVFIVAPFILFSVYGIEKTIESMPQYDIAKLNLAADWKHKKKQYYAKINQELQDLAIPFRFGDAPGQTSAIGELKFKTQAIEKWGAQLYRITEAGGSLVHTSQTPGTEEYRIVSQFDLTNSDSNIIRGSMGDVIGRMAYLFCPCLSNFIAFPHLVKFFTILLLRLREWISFRTST